MNNPALNTQPDSPTKPDHEGWVHGYADPQPDGSLDFMGLAPYMTLVPGFVPAKFNVNTNVCVPTGNPMVVKKGEALITDAGFGGGEQIISGAEVDVGSGFAPTGAVSVGIQPPSAELAAKIAARKAQAPEAPPA